jgi:hypothetical protein
LAQENDTDISFSPCPLIGAYYPPPTISKPSGIATQLESKCTQVFDDLIKNGGSEDYGAITPNTTSFSVVLFGGSPLPKDDPIIFEYHYTSPKDQSLTSTNLTSHTKFPVGDVTMVFTVYAWLVDKGEQWETPITHYLPELAQIEGPLTVPWEDVTIGSLAGQMSGLSRQCKIACSPTRLILHSYLPAIRFSPSMRYWWTMRLERRVLFFTLALSEVLTLVLAFARNFAKQPPVFLPDTTPIVSYAAFQLLVFAMQKESNHGSSHKSWTSVLDDTLLRPLNMTSTGLLSPDTTDVFAIDGLNTSQLGEPG